MIDRGFIATFMCISIPVGCIITISIHAEIRFNPILYSVGNLVAVNVGVVDYFQS